MKPRGFPLILSGNGRRFLQTCSKFRSGDVMISDAMQIKPYKDIPGPRPLPLLGNTWRFIPFIGKTKNIRYCA